MKNTLTIATIIFIITFISHGCSSYENKKEYNLKVGEKFEIYYTSNSCCGRCWNLEQVDNIEIIENRTIHTTETPGATSKYAKVFRTVKAGIDTIKTSQYAMSDSCNLNSGKSNVYVINISN